MKQDNYIACIGREYLPTGRRWWCGWQNRQWWAYRRQRTRARRDTRSTPRTISPRLVRFPRPRSAPPKISSSTVEKSRWFREMALERIEWKWDDTYVTFNHVLVKGTDIEIQHLIHDTSPLWVFRIQRIVFGVFAHQVSHNRPAGNTRMSYYRRANPKIHTYIYIRVCVPFAQNEAIIVYRRYYVLRIQLRSKLFLWIKKKIGFTINIYASNKTSELPSRIRISCAPLS